MLHNEPIAKLFEPYTTEVLQEILKTNEERKNHYELLQKNTCNDSLKRIYKARLEAIQETINKLNFEIERREKLID